MAVSAIIVVTLRKGDKEAGRNTCKISRSSTGENRQADRRRRTGYKVTSKLVCESALCLVEDADALPGGAGYGGVLTSASGLGQALIDRLSKTGIHFDGPLQTE